MSVYKDIYLPIHCYASKKQFYSLVGECACMTKCKFMSESKRNQDYRNSEWGKTTNHQRTSVFLHCRYGREGSKTFVTSDGSVSMSEISV
jgi:hypothetical protein